MPVSRYADELTAAMDAVVAHRRDDDDWEARGGGAWRASSLGACPRQQVLARIPLPSAKVFDPKTLRTFEMGHLLGDWVVDIYEQAGWLVAREPRFHSDPWQLTGHADAVLLPKNWDGTSLLGMELKTANASTMQSVVEYGPKAEHKAQVGGYMLMATTTPLKGEDVWYDGNPDIMSSWHPTLIESWVLVYVGKDYAGVLVIDAEPSWMTQASETLTLLNDHWESHTLPVCTCTTAYGGTGPFYCNYLDRDQDVKLVAAMAHGTSKAKHDMAPRVMCCARSPEGLDNALGAWKTKERKH